MDVEVEPRVAVDPATGSFDAFFRKQFPGVARAAALVVHDFELGQDFAQEGFARLYARWAEMDSVEHARNFVYRVAINLARSHLRKYLRLSLFGLRRTDGLADPATPDRSAQAEERMAIVEALAALSPKQRACVVLVDYAGHDARSAGGVLRMRPEVVRVHLMRGRRTLRERLAERKEES